MSKILRVKSFDQLPLLANIEEICGFYPWSLETIQCAHMHGDIFFAYDDFSGYCCLAVVCDFAELRSLSVLPSEQRKSKGWKLCQHCIEFCKKMLLKCIYLEVAIDNFVALKLYQKCGFETVGTRKNYYDDGKDAFVMQLVL